MTIPKPVVLCILDGWGLREDTAYNAPALANTPNFERLMATCPNNTLITHGPDVGLPTGQMGNSEVGHTNIGAGRVVAMDLGQIDLAIEDGSFFKNKALLDFAAKVKAAGGTAHIAGLVSPGGVHSHQNHLVAAAKALTDAGLTVAIHAITDGRDVAPQSAREQLAAFQADLPEGARIVTLSGRYFAMDRDNRWERVSLAYKAIAQGDGKVFSSVDAAISSAYNNETTDEFIRPVIIDEHAGLQDGDGLFFINFRADRTREILRAIGEPGFDEFAVGARPTLSALLGMVEYSDAHNAYMTTCFPKRDIVNTLAEWVAKHGKTQFHTAETEKYPHVTFFLNGGKEAPVEGETRYMAASPKVATYDLQPEMSAPDVTEHFVQAIHDGFDLIVTNFANPDMVGHTGDLDAAIAACEAVDQGLGKVIAALEEVGGAMIVTADHGNCETMWDDATNGPHTAHTTNLVPVVLMGAPDGSSLAHGRLADLAPTVLELMDLPKPAEMTGESLIRP
ncbi:2,3-bisphosphoglycerate-independent phosphoglycerate mutase [Aliiroseovarius pelagivivens]|uniref:2,3-bisphosphoglycerate-independent phosphoglycerate mutase n=1 Tax=Aliiroseovarius pelagivivens TaxID=1639690 RepID=A0A2R8AT73_9RHOB|nr:2,3-bisphosphoglycerate-independent phosphoglycerate mutase [Aliiroseovarius pelagivivens]SPF79243.1 2,3-bisphosphoglycerate-independent phosphoglycerate mutase [Aliiroseovarius pelagivivens]